MFTEMLKGFRIVFAAPQTVLKVAFKVPDIAISGGLS